MTCRIWEWQRHDKAKWHKKETLIDSRILSPGMVAQRAAGDKKPGDCIPQQLHTPGNEALWWDLICVDQSYETSLVSTIFQAIIFEILQQNDDII